MRVRRARFCRIPMRWMDARIRGMEKAVVKSMAFWSPLLHHPTAALRPSPRGSSHRKGRWLACSIEPSCHPASFPMLSRLHTHISHRLRTMLRVAPLICLSAEKQRTNARKRLCLFCRRTGESLITLRATTRIIVQAVHFSGMPFRGGIIVD